jgi:hypothetical protein
MAMAVGHKVLHCKIDNRGCENHHSDDDTNLCLHMEGVAAMPVPFILDLDAKDFRSRQLGRLEPASAHANSHGLMMCEVYMRGSW